MAADSRRSFWRTFGIAWAGLAIMMALWSITTPIGGAPDEPAHLAKAASVVRGEFIGSASNDGQRVHVPEYIAFTPAQTCYALNSNVDASCIPNVPGDADRTVTSPTTAGLYNPLYYAIVGWPSLIAHDSSGIYWMRIVSGIIVSLFLALTVALVASWRRGVLPVIGLLAAATPMVLFLGGTVNPNSLEITATLAAFVALITIIREPDSGRPMSRPVILFVSAAVAANMRGLSVLWLAVVLLIPLLLLPKDRLLSLLKTKSILLAVSGIAVASVAAVVWVLSTNSLGSGLTGAPSINTAPAVGTAPILGFIWTIVYTFDYGQQIVGVFGWLDTFVPPYVYFFWAVIIGALTILGTVLLRRRSLWVTVGLTAAVLLIPPILQAIYITKGGVIWQGRYTLPLFVCLVVWLGIALTDRISLDRRTGRRLIVVLLILWVLAQFLAFATALRRYAVGLDHGWQTLLHPLWSPPGGVALPLALFGLVLVGASIGLYLLARTERDLPGSR